MATLKTLTEIKTILKSNRVGMIELMQQINELGNSKNFAFLNSKRYQISKALYAHLGDLADRQHTFYSQPYGKCINHFKTVEVNC